MVRFVLSGNLLFRKSHELISLPRMKIRLSPSEWILCVDYLRTGAGMDELIVSYWLKAETRTIIEFSHRFRAAGETSAPSPDNNFSPSIPSFPRSRFLSSIRDFCRVVVNRKKHYFNGKFSREAIYHFDWWFIGYRSHSTHYSAFSLVVHVVHQ